MRRAYTIGAPSMFVNKNRLGRYPEFRDQGVGGSNPLSPTNPFKDLTSILYILCETRRSAVQPLAFPCVAAAGLQLVPIPKDSESRRPVMFSVVTSELPVTRPESRCRPGMRFIFICRGLPRMRRHYYPGATRVCEVPYARHSRFSSGTGR